MDVRECRPEDEKAWDAYVESHPRASVFHLSPFRRIIQSTYRHRSHYLIAGEGEKITGILPLFFMAGPFVGRALISLPFFDYGGLVADDAATAAALLEAAHDLSLRQRCTSLELRQTYRLEEFHPAGEELKPVLGQMKTNTMKVAMRLALPDTSDALFASFPDKLRSQIRRSRKEGCTVESGGVEKLDDFYDVFVHNMRDLGSPVHSKAMMRNVLSCYGDRSRIFIVYHGAYPIACSLAVGFRDMLVNPWASARRSYKRIAPNMLTYWAMFEYAIQTGYRRFDFGRSTRDEGTFRFKAQWGALPEELIWYYRTPGTGDAAGIDSKNRELFVSMWRKLPLPVTRWCGPVIRRHIPL